MGRLRLFDPGCTPKLKREKRHETYENIDRCFGRAFRVGYVIGSSGPATNYYYDNAEPAIADAEHHYHHDAGPTHCADYRTYPYHHQGQASSQEDHEGHRHNHDDQSVAADAHGFPNHNHHHASTVQHNHHDDNSPADLIGRSF